MGGEMHSPPPPYYKSPGSVDPEHITLLDLLLRVRFDSVHLHLGIILLALDVVVR